jgi:transposase-like protein
MVCSIAGKRWYLWRAVDDEGVALDRVMQRGRDTAAARKLHTRLLKNQPVAPESIVTDGLSS